MGRNLNGGAIGFRDFSGFSWFSGEFLDFSGFPRAFPGDFLGFSVIFNGCQGFSVSFSNFQRFSGILGVILDYAPFN